jgi:hypothetical protein
LSRESGWGAEVERNMTAGDAKRRWWLLLLLGLTLVRGVIYAAVVPPWQAPDETGHFEYAWLMAQEGWLPDQEDISPAFEQELLGSLYERRYGEYIERALPQKMPVRVDDLSESIFARRARTVRSERFSLAYVWQALFLLPVRHQDLVVQLYAARFSSVVLNVVIVWLAWCIFGEVVPERPGLAAAMVAFMVFLPQHTFINASVSDGPLAEAAACIVFYGWLLLFRRQRARSVSVMGAGLAAAGTAVAMWTKKTGAFLLPLDVGALVLLLVLRYRGAARRRRLAYFASGLVLSGILVVLLLRAPVGRSMGRKIEQWWTAPEVYLENEQVSLGEALWQAYDSFWGQFGWMNVRVGDGWYVVVYALGLAAIEGWVWPRWRGWRISRRAKAVLGLGLVLAVAVWLGFVMLTPSGLAYHMGRYLFPAMVAAGFFLVGGWARWMPEQWQKYVLPGVVGVLAVVDATALCTGVWPFFYGG